MVRRVQRLVQQFSCSLCVFDGSGDMESCFRLTALFHTDGLALNGNAPQVFTRVNRWGLPYVAVATNSLFGLLGYMAVSNGAGTVFGW